MADTYVTCSVSPCTVVIQLDSPLLAITPEEALQVAVAILGAWAVGFCFRAVIQLLKDGPTETESEN